ncbi:hypothetical protein C5167_048316 [Papaver somniferum]|uniref:Uncharacterized protein n=1 Tax=Papaver somniferum TaxID=3469 RepID=A0A4Y7KIZ5_PAPSO|nr:hypothetical protein C5167_048316 [Papaver somniferum]
MGFGSNQFLFVVCVVVDVEEFFIQLDPDSNSATSPGSDSDRARASFPARAKKNLLVDLIRLSSVLCLSYLPVEVDSRQDVQVHHYEIWAKFIISGVYRIAL